MNKRLRSALTISATALMLMGFGGLVSYANGHVHADCTTALDQTDESSDDVANSVNNTENNLSVNDPSVSSSSSKDAQTYLYIIGGSKPNSILFDHYYIEPCRENNYKVDTIGHLADNMSLSSGYNGGYEDNQSNRDRIANALDNNEETVYNDEVYFDATNNYNNGTGTDDAQITSSADSDNVPLTDPDKLESLREYNNYITTDENEDKNNNDDAYQDAYNYLNDSSDDNLFAHAGEEPDNNAYGVAVIGQLADQMAEYPDGEDVKDDNYNIKNALTSDELKYYNMRLGFDGAKLNLYIDANPYQYSTDPDAYYALKSNSNSTPANHPRYHTGYFNSEGEWVKYHTGYYNGDFRWQKYHTGYFNNENRWVRYRTGYFDNNNHWIHY